MVITASLIVILGTYISYMIGYSIGKKRGIDTGVNNQIELFNKELESEPRTGVFTIGLTYGKEPIEVKAEIREIGKGNKKCKVEYTSFHVTPLKFNKQEKWDEIKAYLGPWVDANRVEWYVEYDTRKRRIQRLLNK